MRLLYPFPEPLPLDKARAIQVIKTVASLAATGIEVHLAYVPTEQGGDPFTAYGMTCPDGVVLCPCSRGLPWPFSGFKLHSNRFFAARLRRLITAQARQGRPFDAIFVRHLKLAHALLDHRLPLVFEAHEVFADGAPPANAEKLARIEKQVLVRADAVFAISAGLVGHIRSRYGIARALPVVPSATDYDSTKPVKDWSQSARHIVYAGNLYGWKGVQDLIDAAALLPGCAITIIGGEPAQIERLQAANPSSGATLDFLGHLPHAEATRHLKDACIAILPNRAGSVSAYTSPLKLFEYMAAGCAIVASDLPVFHEVLETNDVAWFPPGNAAALADAIRQLVSDPEHCQTMGEHLHTLAARYTWEARAGSLKAIIADACGRAGSNKQMRQEAS